MLLLAETEYDTVPLPLPLPEFRLIQEPDLLGVQSHPAGAVTLMLSLPPEDVKELLDGEMP